MGLFDGIGSVDNVDRRPNPPVGQHRATLTGLEVTKASTGGDRYFVANVTLSDGSLAKDMRKISDQYGGQYHKAWARGVAAAVIGVAFDDARLAEPPSRGTEICQLLGADPACLSRLGETPQNLAHLVLLILLAGPLNARVVLHVSQETSPKTGKTYSAVRWLPADSPVQATPAPAPTPVAAPQATPAASAKPSWM